MHTQTHIFQYSEKIKFFKVHDWSNGQYETIITFVFDDTLFVFAAGQRARVHAVTKFAPHRKRYLLRCQPDQSIRSPNSCVCV